jgi:hypothetical protein
MVATLVALLLLSGLLYLLGRQRCVPARLNGVHHAFSCHAVVMPK